MRIAVCDDELIYRKKLKTDIEGYYKDLNSLIYEFTSGEELLKHYITRENAFDLIFIDIEMKGINGIETAKRLRAFDNNVIIIFLTSHAEYAPDGYEVSAFRYLIKPIEIGKLYKTLQQADDRLQKELIITVCSFDKELLLNTKDIVYIEANNKEVLINTLNSTYIDKRNLNEFEQLLKESGFFRTHRSYLVNLSYVREYDNKDIWLENKAKVHLSRSNSKAFKEKLFQNIIQKADRSSTWN